jgi:hypothetical protein
MTPKSGTPAAKLKMPSSGSTTKGQVGADQLTTVDVQAWVDEALLPRERAPLGGPGSRAILDPGGEEAGAREDGAGDEQEAGAARDPGRAGCRETARADATMARQPRHR